MIFRQVINEDLACASYVLADAGEAVVVDPAWDIEPYLVLARAHRFVIRHVVDTHVHADHVSGRNRLVAATGAIAHLPPRSGVSAPHELLRAGASIQVGSVRLETLPTPGHRPEHVSLLVTDASRSEQPCLVLCGDSLLVGDVARPDLAVPGEQVEEAARALFGSLQRIAALGDDVEVWPGHIGGSLCGAVGLSGRVSSTVGFERRSNPGLLRSAEAEFVEALGGRLPERPATVDVVVSLNRQPEEAALPVVAELAPAAVRMLQTAGALVVDGRPAETFDVGSIPGSLSIPLEALGVGQKAACFARAKEAIIAVAASDDQARELVNRLRAVGLENVRGVLGGGLSAWRAAGFPVAVTSTLELDELASLVRQRAVTLVDVRDEDEYAAAHLPGSLHVPWRELRARSHEVAVDGKPVVVACASGRRTPFAASALARELGVRVARLAHGGIVDLGGHGAELVRQPENDLSVPRGPAVAPPPRPTRLRLDLGSPAT